MDNPTKFSQYLFEIGFKQLYEAFGPWNVRPWDWNGIRNDLPEPLKTVWEVLLLQKKITKQRSQEVFGRALAKWLNSTVFECDEENVSLGGFSMIGNGSTFAFVDVSRSKMLDVTAPPNSLMPHEGRRRRHLSMFSTTAIDNVMAKRRNWNTSVLRFDGADYRPISKAFHINGISIDKTIVEQAELGTYSFITACPPCLPRPEERHYVANVDGGANGLSRLTEILNRLPELLEPDGVAEVSLMIFSNEGAQRVQEVADMLRSRSLGGQITVLSRISCEPDTSAFLQMAGALQNGDSSLDKSVAALSKHFTSIGVTHIYFSKLVIKNTDKLTVTSTAKRYYGGYQI